MIFVCMAVPLFGQSFYRYLDLTPTMDLLPRAEVDPLFVDNLVCFQLTVSGDTLDVLRLDRGVPAPVYNFPAGFSVVTTDSVVTWTGGEDHSSGYRVDMNEDGLPVLLSRLDGNAVQEWVWENDSTVSAYSFDSLGSSIDVVLLPNYAGTAVRLDELGDLEHFKYETVSASAWQYTLNGLRRAVSKRAVCVSGEIIPTADGVSETRYTYDASGNLTSTRLFDVEGNLLPNDYAAVITGNYAFDRNGVVINEVKVAFTEQLFDENSLYILERHYGTDGNFVENSFGVASIALQRDVLGGISVSVWLDIEGNRTEIEGISVTRRLFNEQGRVIESSTCNSDLEITDFPGGFAYTRFTYAEDGQPELISYYNSSGLPVINTSLGCHARSFVYDEDGRCTEIRYLDTAYDLVNLATGYARIVSVFNKSGNLMEHLFFDRNGMRVQP
ncbi:MAG: hypothetical protein KAR40_15530 [Candidatus Sabulitectum sp.]|nr:hypothetical protein [Candidatus Sabulitectum sp.]